MGKKSDLKLYHICNEGCDDETEMDIALTDEEFQILDRVFDELNEHSTYCCKPKIYISLVEDVKDEM